MIIFFTRKNGKNDGDRKNDSQQEIHNGKDFEFFFNDGQR
jgi:hypothetical protein